MTLKGVMGLIFRYFTEFCSFWSALGYVKVVEDTQTRLRQAKESIVFSDISFIAIFAGDHPSRR